MYVLYVCMGARVLVVLLRIFILRLHMTIVTNFNRMSILNLKIRVTIMKNTSKIRW